ncbi:MAG: proliferating cell nuclear antigen (pcna) [Candidatus Woesearchaeota archaeon]
MKLTLTEPRFLKESVSIISDLVTEAQFKVSPEGIELTAMDPANVAMVIFKLLSSAFAEYEVKEKTTISINLSDLKQVLKRASPTDSVTLEIAENKLKIKFKGVNTRTFYLPLIDIEEKEQRIPELNFMASVTTQSSLLNQAIDDVDIIGESVNFIVEPDKFTVTSSSELSKANIEIPADKNTKIKAKAIVKSKYSIEYLKKMIQGSKLSEQVNINLSNDYPLELEYKVLDRVRLLFILAPRVDND